MQSLHPLKQHKPCASTAITLLNTAIKGEGLAVYFSGTPRAENTSQVCDGSLRCNRRQSSGTPHLQVPRLPNKESCEKEHDGAGRTHQQRHAQTELLCDSSSGRGRDCRTDDLSHQGCESDGGG